MNIKFGYIQIILGAFGAISGALDHNTISVTTGWGLMIMGQLNLIEGKIK